MSPGELTSAALLRLLRDVRRDRESMDVRAASAAELGRDLQAGRNGSIAAVLALALHHYYTAFESALSRIVRAVEGDLPGGADWHAAIVENAAAPLVSLRPALIGPERLPALAELRRFRHFLRNAYAVDLDPIRLVALATTLDSLHPDLSADLDETIRFLEAVNRRLPT